MEKGKLKIFFGYSAGVGKTYSMLIEAQEQQARGVDVIIGYVEPHMRPETMKLTEGIEALPLKTIDYKGIELHEFDVDCAILRKPELILVDELAHTNAQTSKHKKRHQDVMELINNGISVYTTVNVQHLEGLKDIIGNATAVKVGETVPDDIFDKADEVELVDIEPVVLEQRLKSGKIYQGLRISTALENFFTEEHLNNLREVSMRRCADRISRQGACVAITPKVLALISPSPSSQKNIRIAAQMASNYHCKFSAMYVERGGELDDESAKNLKEHIKLVSDLDGETVIKYGESIVETIETYVKLCGITNIIIGKTWQSIGKKVGFEDLIIASLPDIEVLIVPDKQSATTKKKLKKGNSKGERWAIGVFVCLIAILSVAFVANQIVPYTILSLVAALIFTGLILEIKKRRKMSVRFKQNNRALDCVNLLIDSNETVSQKARIESIARIMSETFEKSVLIDIDNQTTIRLFETSACNYFESNHETAIRKWCIANNLPSGKGTETLRTSKATYLPIRIDENTVACIAFDCEKTKLTVTDKLLFSQLKNVLSLLLKNK